VYKGRICVEIMVRPMLLIEIIDLFCYPLVRRAEKKMPRRSMITGEAAYKNKR
jgi:hypothetical protein